MVGDSMHYHLRGGRKGLPMLLRRAFAIHAEPMFRRRAVTVGAALVSIAPSLAAERLSTERTRKIGGLYVGSDLGETAYIRAIREGLRQQGWIEGKNIVTEWRYANGDRSRLAMLAGELVARKVEMIVVAGDEEIDGALRGGPDLPIVVCVALDPVGAGHARSLQQPGGRVTGLAWGQSHEIVQRYVQFLKELVPDMQRLGVLREPALAGSKTYSEVGIEGARKLGVTCHFVDVTTDDGLDAAFATLVAQQVQA